MEIKVPVSRFAQKYREVLTDAKRTNDVIVLSERSGDDSWVVTSERRHRANREAARVMSSTMRSLAQEPSTAPGLAVALAESLPWIRFLPSADREDFIRELVETIGAAVEVDNNASVGELIEEWRNTAEIHSDSELARQLATSIDDPIDEPVL